MSWRKILPELIIKLNKVSINWRRLYTICKNCKKKCKVFWTINYQSLKLILWEKYLKGLIVSSNWPKIKIPLQSNKYRSLLSIIVYKNMSNNVVKFSQFKLFLKTNKVTLILRSMLINLIKLTNFHYLIDNILKNIKNKFNKNR